MIPQPTVAYLHQQIADTLRKVLKAAEHSFRANASSLVISTALRFKLVKKMINATKKQKQLKKKTTITWFARRKVSSCTCSSKLAC